MRAAASELLVSRVNGSRTVSTPRGGTRHAWPVLRLLLILCLSAVVRAGVHATPETFAKESGRWAFPELRFQRGDDPRWAATDFDDSAWRVISPRELPSRDGIYWVRWRVTRHMGDLFGPRDGLLFKMVASYDLYWDGKLVGRNGRVSTVAEDEGPGYVDAMFQIPGGLLAPGEHVIALRLSSWNTGFPTPTYSLIYEWGNFRSMLVQRSRTAIFSVMAVGAAFVVAIVFGLMWLLAGRRFPVLLFSLLFLCVALMQALQASRWLFEYPYNWHYPRLLASTALTTAIGALLPLFVLHQFELGRRRWVYGVLAVLLTVAWFTSPIYNFVSLSTCAIGFAMALALAVQARALRRRGSAVACGGLALSVYALVRAPRDFLDHAFFLSAGPAVVGLLTTIVLQLRDERREAQRAVLAAARLEIELLKKNLQPHFLLNTLATIIEVIEQEPKTAVSLVEALAGEFRILSRVSGEKLIPLGQELELCRAHLRVMSLRKGARCTLTVRGGRDEALVPPALFHTLIENGLTHLLPIDGRQDFELSAERRAGGTRYVLRAHGQRQPADIRAGGAADAAASREGTGLRYIKARLEESFTGHWSIAATPVPEGWQTVIEIDDAGGSASRTSAERNAAPALPEERPA